MLTALRPLNSKGLIVVYSSSIYEFFLTNILLFLGCPHLCLSEKYDEKLRFLDRRSHMRGSCLAQVKLKIKIMTGTGDIQINMNLNRSGERVASYYVHCQK
jgi:hypothetical protein